MLSVQLQDLPGWALLGLAFWPLPEQAAAEQRLEEYARDQNLAGAGRMHVLEKDI